jgi:hypothetical protein
MLSFIVIPHHCVKSASMIDSKEESTSSISNSCDHSIDSSDSMTTLTAQYEQYGQQLIDGTAGQANDSTPAQQCGEKELIVDATTGGGHCSDDSSMSTWSYWGEDPALGFSEENSLEEEDDYVVDIFGIDSSFHATRFTPLTGGTECYMVDVVPSSLFNPAVY